MRAKRTAALVLSVAVAAGCATTPPPYTGQGPHPQLERGASVPPVDFLYKGGRLHLPHLPLAKEDASFVQRRTLPLFV